MAIVFPSITEKNIPNPARILVFPGPPRKLPSHPPDVLGEYANPSLGENRLRCGTSVFGTPASPGYTRLVGAVVKTLDCSPSTNVGICVYFSVHYCLTSQRTP